MVDPLKLAAFRRAAETAHPNDPARSERLVQMEGEFLDSQFSTDPDQDFQFLLGLFSDKSIHDLMDWLRLRSLETRPLFLDPLTGPPSAVTAQSQRVESSTTPLSPATQTELVRTHHNERVKLNSTFFNSLAVWSAGAGAAGALINTTLAATHNFLGAGEIGIAGVVAAIVLKWLANREIGKLR